MWKKNLKLIVLCFIIVTSCGKKTDENKQYFYYENGNISNELIKVGDKLYLTHYNKSGELKSRGALLNGKVNGWWNYYKDKKIRVKIEFITRDNKQVANQQINYDTNGKIIDSMSHYFVLKIPDTIKKGKSRITFSYHKYFKVKSDILVCTGYGINKDFTNISKVKIDSFYVEDPKNGWTQLEYNSSGQKMLRGFFYERNYKTIQNLKNKDSATIIFNEHVKFFEKEIYVK